MTEYESAGVNPRFLEEICDPQPPEITQYNRHHYECDSCGTRTVASHLDCPDGGQFGVNVIAPAALSRYDHRLPYRKVADRFEQLRGLELSGTSAWHATASTDEGRFRLTCNDCGASSTH